MKGKPAVWNPTELWLEGAVMAVLHAAGPEQGYWVEETGLLHDDGSSNWWQLMPFEGGRAIVMGKDHDLPGDLYDALPRALSDAPGWLRDAWQDDAGPLRSAVRARAPIGFFRWVDEHGTWGEVPTDPARDDGSALVRAPYSESGERLFEDCTDADELREAYRLADAAFDAARAGTLDAEVLLPVLRRADPERARPFDMEAALAVAARAGLTPGTARPALPGANLPQEVG